MKKILFFFSLLASLFQQAGTVGGPTTLGQISNYNGITTTGQGIAPIVSYSSTTPTTPVGATNILASAPAGVYRIGFYSVVTTTGVGGTNFVLNLTYTDAKQAQTLAVFTNSTFTAGNVNEGFAIVQQQATGNIQYTVTESGVFSTHPVLALFLTMERIQ
jgi:hypothetical protein